MIINARSQTKGEFLFMKFGAFDDQRKEYVIHTPQTP